MLETVVGNVGKARRLAAEAALKRYSGPLDRCWLANTDADSVVTTEWLTEQLKLVEAGAQVVAGIVDVDNFGEHSSLVEARFRHSYKLYSDGSHPHVHGANFGVRADFYRLAGGWSNRQTAEDWDLWNRLAMVGAKRQSATQVRVITSGRKTGRAPEGFAAALAAHNVLSV